MNPKLIQKINRMKEVDQKVRFDFPYKYLVLLVDTVNKIKIKRIIQKYGYPTIELLGEEGLKNFWLLIQHLYSEVELQKKCLENCHFAPTEYAYLYDRISVNSRKDQKYGTQLNKPIKDLYETNRNRVELGMLTITDWIEDFNASDEKGRKIYLFPKEDGSAEYGTNFHKKFPITNEYTSNSGEEYYFEYYETDNIDHLPKNKISQVRVCAFEGDKLLIVNNVNKDNSYGLIGGAVEEGESPEDALVREVKEESNMKVLEHKLIGYQKAVNKTKNIEQYQLRYFARVEPLGEFNPNCDPDGDVTEIIRIDPLDYKKYFDWGEIGDVIMSSAINLKNSEKMQDL
jgi:ADP-ribose pyrophosphatase YjhB (NUDIX family)